MRAQIESAASQSFSLRKEEGDIANALEDVDRYAEKKSWELVCRAIATVADADPTGLVVWKEGVLLPVGVKLWHSLCALPPEGREAIRLFFNPKAKQLFDEYKARESAVAAQGATTDLSALMKIVRAYFLTASGDDAADYLADAQFERGEFGPAAQLWADILAHYPETDLPPVRLEVKRAAALARAGRWTEFDAIAQRLNERYVGESVNIGGKAIGVSDYLASLTAGREMISGASPSTAPAAAPVHPGNVPLWEMTFQDDEVRQMINDLMMQGWYISTDLLSYVPCAATDGKSVYVNWLSACFAIDVETGKLLWRTLKFPLAPDSFRVMVQAEMPADRSGIIVAGQNVYAVTMPANPQHRGDGQFDFMLICLKADTGEKKWSSEAGPLNEWTFIGAPVLVGSDLFVTAQKRGTQEYSVVSVDPETGELRWSVALGSPQSGTTMQGNPKYPVPSLVPHDGSLYVVTNNGALVAINPAGRRIEWAFVYEGPTPYQRPDFFFGGMELPRDTNVPGLAVIRDGVLYAKERGGRSLMAIDLAGPSIAWKRPLDAAENIASLNQQRVLVIGSSLSAIDMSTRAMQWSRKLPVQTPYVRAAEVGSSVMVLTSRGIYQVDADTGSTTNITRLDKDNVLGGALFVSADAGKLISVSNLGVAAYALEPTSAPTGGASANGGSTGANP